MTVAREALAGERRDARVGTADSSAIAALEAAPGQPTRWEEHEAPSAAIDSVDARAFTIPTDAPESDGTIEWDRTTIVVARVRGGGVEGLGYSYADATAAALIDRTLGDAIVGCDATSISLAWSRMVGAVRNIGRPGIAATAISAMDIALWDLKAKLLGLPLVDLLGAARPSIPAYGSGGFTSYTDERLRSQLGGWSRDGFRMVKMKVGREPWRDGHRVDVARDAIGDDVELFLDANGAFDRSHALAAAVAFAGRGVTWFEEPVSSDDVAGLRFLRDRAPAGMAIAAGEYGWDQFHFRRLLEAGAVDVLQADATRCLGVTGFLLAAALCEAHGVALSSHCAPAIHAHLMCSARPGVHLEWFHDHARIEAMFFEGAPRPVDGRLTPARSRPGLGLVLREPDAAPYLSWSAG